MRLLFRRTFQPDDLMILISENKEEAKLLMKLGQMKPTISGSTPPNENNVTITDMETGEVTHKTSAQLQILFQEAS